MLYTVYFDTLYSICTHQTNQRIPRSLGFSRNSNRDSPRSGANIVHLFKWKKIHSDSHLPNSWNCKQIQSRPKRCRQCPHISNQHLACIFEQFKNSPRMLALLNSVVTAPTHQGMPLQRWPVHYAARPAIWRKKSYHEMFNFENWFLCQFSSNTRFSFGGGSFNTPNLENAKRNLQISI